MKDLWYGGSELARVTAGKGSVELVVATLDVINHEINALNSLLIFV